MRADASASSASPYPQAALLRQCLAAARQVNIKALVDTHKNPQTLAAAIRQSRVEALAVLTVKA